MVFRLSQLRFLRLIRVNQRKSAANRFRFESDKGEV